jgi:hypothetical protein
MFMVENTASIDPKYFPKSIELDLSQESFEQLCRLSELTGLSIDEVATNLIDRALHASDGS